MRKVGLVPRWKDFFIQWNQSHRWFWELAFGYHSSQSLTAWYSPEVKYQRLKCAVRMKVSAWTFKGRLFKSWPDAAWSYWRGTMAAQGCRCPSVSKAPEGPTTWLLGPMYAKREVVLNGIFVISWNSHWVTLTIQISSYTQLSKMS